MKTWTVIIKMTTEHQATVKAETYEEAHRLAMKLDEGDFTPVSQDVTEFDWYVDTVEEDLTPTPL